MGIFATLFGAMAGRDDPCPTPASNRHRLVAGLSLLALVTLTLAIVLPLHRQAQADSDYPPRPAPITSVTVLPTVVTRPLPSGFVGVSMEYPTLRRLAGTNPHAVNPVLPALLRSLAPGQRPVVRIGGISADYTWVPIRGLPRPAGIRYTLTASRIAVLRYLTAASHARLILGLDLEAGNPDIPVAEARVLLARLGRRAIDTFEIGNEPLRFRLFPWYRTRSGQNRWARGRKYDFAAYNREFAVVARRMPPGVGLAGPTQAGVRWMDELPQFMASQPRLNTITYHRYPLSGCARIGTPMYPTLARLLSPNSSIGLAAPTAGYAATARRFHLPFRIDELNSVSCGGRHGISNTAASALWALDALFALARAGVAGVNFHTYHRAGYELFDFGHRADGRWPTTVRPIFYGLLMFARAAPPRSRQLAVLQTGPDAVRVWADRTPRRGTNVVLINRDGAQAHVVSIAAPSRARTARILRLTAPGLSASDGVQLGGESFSRTTDGRLPRLHVAHVVRSLGGRYVVSLPPASAALVSLSR